MDRHRKASEAGGILVPSLEEVASQIQSGESKELNLIIKTDVQGSIDAVRSSLERLATEKAKVRIVHTGSGSVTGSDVLLAVASDAVIIGFNSRPEPGAKHLAEQEGVEIRFYDIIYRLADDIQKTLHGLLDPTFQDVIEGHAEVRAVFSMRGKTKVAGAFVREGRIARDSLIRVVRGGEVVFEGRINSLKHFKDDVREMTSGYECGIGIEGFKDFKFGMTWNQIKATGVCKNWAFIFGGVGTECYKVAGEKRYFYFSFEHWQKNTDGSYAAQNLRRIGVALGKFMPSYYKKLASDLGKKYKEKYRLTIEQSIGLNKGNLITFFEDARVTLVQKDNGINLYYTKAEHPTYKIYSPKDISSDEF